MTLNVSLKGKDAWSRSHSDPTMVNKIQVYGKAGWKKWIRMEMGEYAQPSAKQVETSNRQQMRDKHS